MSDDPKRELEDFVALLRQNKDLLKPNFGVMFWQLAEAEERLSPEEFAEVGMSYTMTDADDEVVGSFIAGYIKAWLSANDFHAASRMIAHTLGMSADELIQTREMFRQARSEQ